MVEFAPAINACFSAGAIENNVRSGLAEELCIGDHVLTLDSGSAPIRFLRKRTLSLAHLRDFPRHAPITFMPGSLGPGLPMRNLRVSPQHRMLSRSNVAKRMFGQSEVLIPATALVGCPGVSRSKARASVTYIHILLDEHHILTANQVETESLLLGSNIMRQFTRAEMTWLRENASCCFRQANKPARTLITGKRVQKYLQRVAKNGHPVSTPKPAREMARAS